MLTYRSHHSAEEVSPPPEVAVSLPEKMYVAYLAAPAQLVYLAPSSLGALLVGLGALVFLGLPSPEIPPVASAAEAGNHSAASG